VSINGNFNYNLGELAAGIEFDREDYMPLLALFVEQTVLDLEEIKAQISECNEEVISERIHNIKGASLNLGLDRIFSLLEEMSTLNHEGKYGSMGKILDKCTVEVDNLKKLLE